MKNLSDELIADEVRSLLTLEPHAAYGFVRVTVPSDAQVPTDHDAFGFRPSMFELKRC